jgi:hypothetical protein
LDRRPADRAVDFVTAVRPKLPLTSSEKVWVAAITPSEVNGISMDGPEDAPAVKPQKEAN